MMSKTWWIFCILFFGLNVFFIIQNIDNFRVTDNGIEIADTTNFGAMVIFMNIIITIGLVTIMIMSIPFVERKLMKKL